MEKAKIVKVTNKGMITIPSTIRKTHNIQDGDNIAIIEDENGIRLVKIELLEDLRKLSYSTKKLKKMMEDSKKTELELEL